MCEKCLEINKTSGIERRQSNCFEFIGRMHLYLGQCKESLAFHEKALELKKKIKDKKKVATSCCAISSLYYNLEALKISEEIKDREMEGVAYANLSNV